MNTNPITILREENGDRKILRLPNQYLSIRNIYGIGRNYVEHIKELQNETPSQPVIFMKSTASICGYNDAIELQADLGQETTHYEAEIVLMVGTNISQKETSQLFSKAVSAIGLGLDLTRRQTQSALKSVGLPWTRAKSFKGASVLTPFLSKDEFRSPNSLCFEFWLNGMLKQQGDPSLMIFSFEQILAEILTLNELLPGDLIFTGTPHGVGPLSKGDTFELRWPKLDQTFKGRL